MKTIVVTCGPSSEPIDAVRRLTNFSTGELGVLVSEKLAQAGHRVICCKGYGSTWPDPKGCEVLSFTTNDELLNVLTELARSETIEVVFHAAALADFKVAEVTGFDGGRVESAKISSSLAEITIRLVAAQKVLPRLRELFPQAKIVGWKYEVEGNEAAALEKGRRQIVVARSNSCVVNGPAYGTGFGVIEADKLTHIGSKSGLAAFLCDELFLATS